MWCHLRCFPSGIVSSGEINNSTCFVLLCSPAPAPSPLPAEGPSAASAGIVYEVRVVNLNSTIESVSETLSLITVCPGSVALSSCEAEWNIIVVCYWKNETRQWGWHFGEKGRAWERPQTSYLSFLVSRV